jgi:hypothetical protein
MDSWVGGFGLARVLLGMLITTIEPMCLPLFPNLAFHGVAGVWVKSCINWVHWYQNPPSYHRRGVFSGSAAWRKDGLQLGLRIRLAQLGCCAQAGVVRVTHVCCPVCCGVVC